MGKDKLTPWFDGTVQPVRNGVYQRELWCSDRVTWSYFADGVWYCNGPSKAYAKKNYAHNFDSCYPDLRWRGVFK